MFGSRNPDETEVENSLLSQFAEKLLDIISIRQLLIIHRKSGTTIYSQSFFEKETDPDLISGFLTAISAFEQELAGVTGGLEELKYKNIRILISIGEIISACLIIDGKRTPSNFLYKTFREFKKTFEERFKQDLLEFEGFVAPFRDIDDLLERYFEVSLLSSHVLLSSDYYLFLADLSKITEKDAKEIKFLPYDQMITALKHMIKLA